MIQTITVGTDGSDTASKAVDFALDIAEKFGAKVVVASSYRPVSEDRLRREQKDAPEDIQWSINPTEEVDSALRAVEEKARARGLEVTSEAREGDPADVLCGIA
jgi:nucleotide-binding universal stress UspA family protein